MEINVKNISKTYKAKQGKRVVFANQTASFYSGTINVLKGPSGCGKTTLLSILGLLETPDSGHVEYVGFGEERNRNAAFRRNNVSFLFQEDPLFEDMTAEEYLRLAGPGRDDFSKRVEKLGISPLLGKKCSELSKGEFARLSILRVIAEDKPIALLDEPTGNLDAENKRIVFETLESMAKERLVIVASHDFDESSVSNCHVYEIGGGEIRPLFERGTTADCAIPDRKRPRKTLGKNIRRHALKSVFGKTRRLTVFSAIASMAFGFFVPCLASASLFDSKSYVASALTEGRVLSVETKSNQTLAKCFRLCSNDVYIDGAGTIPIPICYGGEGSLYFETEVGSMADDQLWLPKSICDESRVSEGDKAILYGKEYGIRSIEDDLRNDGSVGLFGVVPATLATERFRSSSIRLVDENVEPLRNFLSNSGIRLPVAGRLIPSQGEVFSLVVPATLKESGWSEEKVLSLLGDREFLIKPGDTASGEFDLSTVYKRISFGGVEFSYQEEDRLFISISIPRRVSEEIEKKYYEYGLLSLFGKDSYVVPSDQFEHIELSPTETDFRGAVSQGDAESAKTIASLSPLFSILAVFVSFFWVAAIVFLEFRIGTRFSTHSMFMERVGYAKPKAYYPFLASYTYFCLIPFGCSLIASVAFGGKFLSRCFGVGIAGFSYYFPEIWLGAAFSLLAVIALTMALCIFCLRQSGSRKAIQETIGD